MPLPVVHHRLPHLPRGTACRRQRPARPRHHPQRRRAHPSRLVPQSHLEPSPRQRRLGTHVRVHDLRHAHASWLLAGGADLQVVKERLGHGTITTTEQYLHTLGGADDTALSALRSIRRTQPGT